MEKNVIKKIGIILLLLMTINILGIYNNKLYATSDVTKDPESWKPTKSYDTGELTEKVNVIAGTVRTIGIIVSVGTLSVLGIKYMLGSVEEKAQYKQTFMPWLIGAIMVFVMTTVPTVIYELSTEMFGTSYNEGGGGGNPIGPGGDGIGPGKDMVQLQ